MDGIQIITILDNKYPALLRLIKDPPPIIYCKGNFNAVKNPKTIAIIGTRDCTKTGHMIAKKTAKHFASKGFSIISGLVKGIDTAAHLGALKGNGKAVVILPNIYCLRPKENNILAQKIVLGDGLLLTENIPGSKISKRDITRNDRLQSALSIGVFPIEAGKKSGTLHAINAAKRYGRPIFCPNITDLIDKKSYLGSEVQLEAIIDLIQTQKAKEYDRSKYKQIRALLSEKSEQLLKEAKLSARRYR